VIDTHEHAGDSKSRSKSPEAKVMLGRSRVVALTFCRPAVKRFDLLLLARYGRFQLLVFAVCFQKLV
jgi:hypothetical protein